MGLTVHLRVKMEGNLPGTADAEKLFISARNVDFCFITYASANTDRARTLDHLWIHMKEY